MNNDYNTGKQNIVYGINIVSFIFNAPTRRITAQRGYLYAFKKSTAEAPLHCNAAVFVYSVPSIIPNTKNSIYTVDI